MFTKTRPKAIILENGLSFRKTSDYQNGMYTVSNETNIREVLYGTKALCLEKAADFSGTLTYVADYNKYAERIRYEKKFLRKDQKCHSRLDALNAMLKNEERNLNFQIDRQEKHLQELKETKHKFLKLIENAKKRYE